MKRLGVVKLLAALVLAAATLAGCTRTEPDRDRVRAALDRAERSARTFTYTDAAPERTTVVEGVVADDLRYSLVATAEGATLASEIVDDDRLALRVPDTSVLSAMARGSAGVPQALLEGGWVVDPTGASSLEPASRSSDDIGRDPLRDALTAVGYARDALVHAGAVQRFDPASITYRKRLDPFPPPARGVVRYDALPRPLPPPGGAEGLQLRQPLPDASTFRVLAVYVRDGVAVEVRERISIELVLSDPRSNLHARLGDFVDVDPDSPVAEKAARLLHVLNAQLATRGRPAIRPRDMHLELRADGAAGTVAIPADAAAGDLSALRRPGQVLYRRG